MSDTVKYYDIHMVVEGDSKSGYSVFVKAPSKEQALQIVIREMLYEDIVDINNIDYIGEITETDFYASGL